MIIKVCGLNNGDNINQLMKLDLDFMGIIFYEKSSRFFSSAALPKSKKKYVAAQQGWKCKKCNEQLSYTFEIDHRISLENGGSNHVTNLDALCVGCHKEKTLEKNLF